MELLIGSTKAVIAALPLRDCVKIPGIKDGSLFRKNVRQSLGNSNKVNKAIAQTIKKDARDFFFLHNGITAICSHMELKGNHLSVKELNVVNGCQSLSTIYSSSETAKKATDAYILSDSMKSANPTVPTKSARQPTVRAPSKPETCEAMINRCWR